MPLADSLSTVILYRTARPKQYDKVQRASAVPLVDSLSTVALATYLLGHKQEKSATRYCESLWLSTASHVIPGLPCDPCRIGRLHIRMPCSIWISVSFQAIRPDRSLHKNTHGEVTTRVANLSISSACCPYWNRQPYDHAVPLHTRSTTCLSQVSRRARRLPLRLPSCK